MSNGEFSQLFQSCLEREGAAYIAARTALLALGEGARAPLAARLGGADWRERLAAEILTGWLDRRQLYEQVGELVGGQIAPTAGWAPLSPTVPPAHRARALADLGPVIVPRLLEILLKSKEHGLSADVQALTQALQLIRDERAVLPLAGLVQQGGAPAFVKVFALGALGALGDPRGFDAAQAALASAASSAPVRAAAAVALGRLGDRRATGRLLAALQDPGEDAAVRRHAARGLGYLGDPAAATALARLLEGSQPPELALTAIDALGRLGGPVALAALERTGREAADPAVREAAAARRSMIA